MAQQPLIIVGSYTSPFVRAVRVACEELHLPYTIEVTSFFAKNTPEQTALVEQNNPLLRVPVLIDAGEVVLDSRIIVSYLIHQHGNKNDFCKSLPQSTAEQNILTVIYGMLDSAILWFILKNTQPGISLEEGYAARSLARVHGSLEWLDQQWEPHAQFGVGESLLICALEWMEKRNIADWRGYKNLLAVHQQFSTRESLVKTRIPDAA